MITKTRKRKFTGSKKRFIGKPNGQIQDRVQAAGPEHFGIVAVKQRARLMIQIRRLLHLAMPGFADLWEDDKLFHKSIALPVALKFSSAEAIRKAGVDAVAKHLRKTKVRFQSRTIERIVAWAGTAAEPSEPAPMQTRRWQQLNEVPQLLGGQIVAAEQELAAFLVGARLPRFIVHCLVAYVRQIAAKGQSP